MARLNRKRALARTALPHQPDMALSLLAREHDGAAVCGDIAIGKGSVSIPSRQPPVMTRSASAARACRRAHFPTCGGRENAARRATHGEVWSATYKETGATP